jgi:hypothetical protein
LALFSIIRRRHCLKTPLLYINGSFDRAGKHSSVWSDVGRKCHPREALVSDIRPGLSCALLFRSEHRQVVFLPVCNLFMESSSGVKYLYNVECLQKSKAQDKPDLMSDTSAFLG